MHIGPDIPSPILNCSASDILGDSICAIISLDYNSMLTVCERLSGKLLPKTLQQFIWTDKLLKADTKVDKFERITILEREARVKFGRTVEHRIAELKIRSATRSPISGLIENVVVEKYEKTPCMHSFATNKQMISETSKTLNVLYVFSGTYEPYLIYWLFPLQMAFKQIMPTAEHPYELAIISERILQLNQKIVQEREKAQELYTATDRSEQNKHLTKELLASPVIFLRKWMGEGFVSIVDFPAVLLIWDQMYMQDWNQKVMENFCLSILMLLKDSLMTANDYPAIRELIFKGPGFIFSKVVYQLTSLGLAGRIKAGKVSLGFQDILPVGVKDVLLKLVLPVPQVEISHTLLRKNWYLTEMH
ncbi:unnamed protein product [Caretta caretta]